MKTGKLEPGAEVAQARLALLLRIALDGNRHGQVAPGADFDADQLPRVAAEFLDLELFRGLPAGIASLSPTDAARRIARCVHQSLPADVRDLPPGLELTQWQLVFVRELAHHVERRPRFERMTLPDWAATALLDKSTREEVSFRPSTLGTWRQHVCDELAKYHLGQVGSQETVGGDAPFSALLAYLADVSTASDILEPWMAVAAKVDSRSLYHQAVSIESVPGTPGEGRMDHVGVALLSALAQGTVVPGLRCWVVGDTDSGKTWFMRYATWASARACRGGSGTPVPIAISARRLPTVAIDEGAASDPLVSLLSASMQEVAQTLPRKSAFYSLAVIGDSIRHLAAAVRVREQGFAVLIDGLDELEVDDFERVTVFLRRLVAAESDHPVAVVMTSRGMPRGQLGLGPTAFGRLVPLDRPQVTRLARAWLGEENRHLVEHVVAPTSQLATPFVVVTRSISALRTGEPESAFRSLMSILERTMTATSVRHGPATFDAWTSVRIRDLSCLAAAYMSERASAALNLPIHIEKAERALDAESAETEIAHRAPREAMSDLIRARHPRDTLNYLLRLGVLRAETRQVSTELWIKDPTVALAAVVGEMTRDRYPILRDDAPWLHESDSLLILLGEAWRESQRAPMLEGVPEVWHDPVHLGDPFLRATVRIQSFLNAAGLSIELLEELTALTLFSPVREHQRRAASVLVRSRGRGRELCGLAASESAPAVRSAALAALIEVGVESDDAALDFLADHAVPKYHRSLAMREFSPLMTDDSLAAVVKDVHAHPEWRLMAADQLRLRGEEEPLRVLLATSATDVRLLAAMHAVGLDRAACVQMLDTIASDPRTHFESRVRAARTLDAIDPPSHWLEALQSDPDEVVRLRAIAEARSFRRRRSLPVSSATVSDPPRAESYSALWAWYADLSPRDQFELRTDPKFVAKTYRAVLENSQQGSMLEICKTAAATLANRVEAIL